LSLQATENIAPPTYDSAFEPASTAFSKTTERMKDFGNADKRNKEDVSDSCCELLWKFSKSLSLQYV